MQNPEDEKGVLGVVYNTSMKRPDAALALCALYGFEGAREARLTSVCVVGAGLNTAIFCDAVAHMYMIGVPRTSNSVLPVGLAAVDPLPPDAPMLRPAIERRNESNEPQYARTIRRISDTSLAEAALRNGVGFNADSVLILSAPATYLAKALDLPGAKEIYDKRVKRLVIVDSGAPQQDIPALRRVLAEWPTSVVFCGPEVGEALRFPAAAIEAGFSWTPAHPVIDAYCAFRPMPYDAPAYDLAAAHFAVHPDSGFFRLSEPGSLSVADDGRMQFSATPE
ncbi:MAG: hypothetical protein M3Z85_07645, partial [Acidobacteriota bacterium]|nr:hypothetical protein [Acidobacteriota bacterium]